MKWLGKINQYFFQLFFAITSFAFLFIHATSIQAVSFWLCSDAGWTGSAGWIRTGEHPDDTPEQISKAMADCNRIAHERGFQNNCIIASSNTPPSQPCIKSETKIFQVACCSTAGTVNPGLAGGTCKVASIEAGSEGQALSKAQYEIKNATNCTIGTTCTVNCNSPLADPIPKPEPDKIRITDPGEVGNILSSMNPLKGGSICGGQLTIGCILSYIVNKIIFPLSTIFLLLMIIWGGYKIVSGSMAGAQNAVQAGKQRLIGAILGFILLASVYWIWQLIEATTKIQIMKKWW